MRARTPVRRGSANRATDREVAVVAAVLVTGSEKAAAHRLGLSHSTVKHHLANARSKVGAETTAQLVWILAARLPEPEAASSRVVSSSQSSARPSRRLPRCTSVSSCRRIARVGKQSTLWPGRCGTRSSSRRSERPSESKKVCTVRSTADKSATAPDAS
ncbi:MAG: hypothetical protein E6I45_12800 [Chloroflexi bacterium]|nr:MAG: hypothetical protein E6I45_12800 [Chloroflexota bacterium]